MKVMLLAAGEGARLQPLTHHCPKALLTVGGVPLIVRHLEALAKAGHVEVGINCCHLGLMLERHLGDGSQWGVSITWLREPELLETGGSIHNALGWLGAEPFVLLNADLLTDYNFGALPRLRAGLLGHLVMVPNPPHHPLGDFSIDHHGLLAPGGRSHTYSGIAIMDPGIVSNPPAKRFPLRIKLDEAIAARRLAGSLFEGYWSDIGSVDRLLAARARVSALTALDSSTD